MRGRGPGTEPAAVERCGAEAALSHIRVPSKDNQLLTGLGLMVAIRERHAMRGFGGPYRAVHHRHRLREFVAVRRCLARAAGVPFGMDARRACAKPRNRGSRAAG